MKKHLYISMVAIGVTLGGCDEDIEQPKDALIFDNTEVSYEVTFREPVDNGVSLNGVSMNGISMNGISMNGISMNGISMNGISMNGVTFGGGTYLNGANMSKLKVVGSKIEMKGDDDVTYRGNALAGTELDMNVNGTPAHIRIEGVVTDANDPAVNYTNVSYRMESGSWGTLCRDGYGNPTEAIIIEGAYDSNGNFLADNGALAFACRGTASAKCIVWGYKPWETVGGVSMRDHYQACLAMVRGDYCRANVPHTVNGTPIDISDHGLPAQVQASGTNWPVEAQWGVNGAVCFNTPRKLIYPRNSINPCYATIPSCPADKNTWVAGGLLMTQANPS